MPVDNYSFVYVVKNQKNYIVFVTLQGLMVWDLCGKKDMQFCINFARIINNIENAMR
jgi:hypothetical protein